jgi:hypothetical protein
MAQQIIDTGAAANDGTGEPLRQAFTDVNTNFTQIWTAGPVGSNVRISNNVISTTGLNQNLIIEANGIGTVNFESTVLPGIDSVYDIGSPSAQFDTIYGQYFVGNGALLTGITADSGSFIVQGTSNVAIPQLNGNIVITVGGNSNTLVISQTAATFAGSLLPSANSQYNLGNVGRQWNNLFAGVINASGAINANGAITGNSTLSVTGAITSAANISGTNFIGNGRFLTGVLSTNGGNLTFSATPPTQNVLQGDIWIDSNSAVQYIYFSDNVGNVWAEMEAYQSFSDGGSGSATDLTAVSSNIVPVNSNVFSIGTSSSQWKDLYVGNGNIFIGNQRLSASGTTLQFNGANVAVQNANPTFATLSITGNVQSANVNTGRVSASGNVTAVGNIQGNYFIGNGSLLTGIAGGGGSLPSDPTFNTVTANTVFTANLEFTGTGPVEIGSGNDINLNTVGQVTFSNVVSLPSKTRAQLNPLIGSIAVGSIAFCSDASGGACPVWYNGTEWLKIADNGAI